MNEDKYSSIIKSNFSLRNYSLTKEKLIEQNQSLKIKIRKTNLFNKMMEKRLSQFDLTKATNYSLEDIVFMLHNDRDHLRLISMNCESQDLIQLGINELKKHLKNKTSNKDLKYILEKIYYRLFDLFVNHYQYQTDILDIFIDLTIENNIFIKALMKDNIVNYLKEKREKFLLDKELNSNIIVLLSNLISIDIRDYFEVNKKIDISSIIRGLLNQNTLYVKEEIVLNLIYNFFNFMPKEMINKNIDIIDYLVRKIRENYYNSGVSYFEDLVDILISACKTKKVLKLLKEYQIIELCGNIIQGKTKYSLQGYKLLNEIFKIAKNKITEIEAILHLKENDFILRDLEYYSSFNGVKESKEIIIYITKCILSIMNHDILYLKQYLNSNFISFLKNIFIKIPSKKIRSNLLLLLIASFDSNDADIISSLIKNELHLFIFSFLIEKDSSKEINNLLLYKCLSFLQLCLNNNEYGNNIKTQLEHYDLESYINKYLQNKDENVCQKAREIFTRHYEEENYYIPNSNRMIIE